MTPIYLTVTALGLLTGCATSMSGPAYERLNAEVAERNAERYKKAEDALKARGLEPADDEALHATLAEEAKSRCLAIHRADPDSLFEPLEDDAQPAVVRVTPARRSDRPEIVGIELRVPVRDACLFFAGRIDHLDARVANGPSARVLRLGEGVHLWRGRRGDESQLSMTVTTFREVSWRHVVVDRECGYTVGPGPDPFEQSRPSRVLLAAGAPSSGAMEVEKREVLDVECTRRVE